MPYSHNLAYMQFVLPLMGGSPSLVNMGLIFCNLDTELNAQEFCIYVNCCKSCLTLRDLYEVMLCWKLTQKKVNLMQRMFVSVRFRGTSDIKIVLI